MSLALLVYLIDISGSFKFISLLTFIFMTFALIIWIYIQMDSDDYHPKSIKWMSGIAIVGLLIFVVIPKERTAYIMVAAHLTQKVYESPDAARIQSKIMTIVNKKLDKFIDEKE